MIPNIYIMRMDKNHICMDTGKNIELDTYDRAALTNAKVLYSWLITRTFFHWKYVIKPAMPAIRYSFEGSIQKCSGSCCRASLKHALEYETCPCMYQKRIKLKTKSSNSSSNTCRKQLDSMILHVQMLEHW